MRKKIIAGLQYVLFLGLGLFLIWYQLKSMSSADKAAFFQSLTQANYWVVVPIIILSLFSHLCRAQSWRLMMEPMGYKPSLANTFCVTMIGYLANSGVPRLGEVLKCTFLSRYEHIPADKLLGTILIERMFDLVCFLGVVGLAFLVEFEVVSSFLGEKFSEGGHINFTKLAIVLGCILLFILVLRFIFKKYTHLKWVHRLQAMAKGIKEGFLTVITLKKRGQFLGLTFLMWLLYLLQIYFGYFAMEAVSGLGFGSSLAVMVLASLAMIITPGGIGTFPLFVMNVLLLYHIPETYGKAFGWLMWGVSTSIMVVSGLICLLIIPNLNKKNYAQGQSHPQ